MNEYGLSIRDMDIFQKVFEQFPEIQNVILFGSRAMGNYKTGSDIDLAVIGPNLNSKLINHINYILNEKEPIPYFIDVIWYNQIKNSELTKHIDENGIEIYSIK